MSLDKALVEKIARLARLDVPEAEIEPLTRDMDGILRWVEQLGEVDTSGVQPMTSVAETSLRQRPDTVDDGGYAEKILANGPETARGFFTVPKMVE